MALDEGEKGAGGDYPEKKYLHIEIPTKEIVKTTSIAATSACVSGWRRGVVDLEEDRRR